MKTIRSILQITIFLGLGLLLIWYSSKDLSAADIENVKNGVFEANWLMIIPCILVIILSHYIRALRWTDLISTIGKKPSVLNVFLAVIIGFFFNLVFPRLGEIMKCTLLGRYEKTPVDRLIGTMVAERMVDVICLVLVIFLTIFIQFNRVSAYTGELLLKLSDQASGRQHWIWLLLFTVLTILFFVYFGRKMFGRHKWFLSIQALIKGFYEGLLSVRRIRHKTRFWSYTFLIWFLYLLSIQVGFYAMPGLTSLTLTPALTILTFGSFAMIATQGGIGAYQLAVQKTLTLYGVDQVKGLAFGWLLWSVQTLMLLISGPLSILWLYLKNKKNNLT